MAAGRWRLAAPPRSFVAGAVLAAVSVLGADAARAQNQIETLQSEGKIVYQRHCVGCHGESGDGKGPGAEMLIVKPRDFTKGIFKFRSTPTGTLPTDEDLYKIVTRGVYRTSMPEWTLLTDRERLAAVMYVKTFYPEWKERGAGVPVYIPPPPATLGSPQSVERGRELYALLECSACHGTAGRGDGISAKSLEPDIWGNPQKPFDFTKGQLKSGPTPGDVYRTFMTGVGGTAMPSYYEIFSEPDNENIFPDDAWHLVSYIFSLRQSPQAAAKEASK